ncbi:MAG: hypothetical protein SRB2_01357 [Desulfobacteraceae bacterium Eth-SRB2]|nr:MAG: hypothetical protein SRB2_01357 [Desulfobacteraceae bacterium Eth-SRB2]
MNLFDLGIITDFILSDKRCFQELSGIKFQSQGIGRLL